LTDDFLDASSCDEVLGRCLPAPDRRFTLTTVAAIRRPGRYQLHHNGRLMQTFAELSRRQQQILDLLSGPA
jgi:hypothetical protein